MLVYVEILGPLCYTLGELRIYVKYLPISNLLGGFARSSQIPLLTYANTRDLSLAENLTTISA